MAGRTERLLVMVGTLALLMFGSASAGASATTLGGVPHFSKVYVIIGENTELGQINASDAPYILGTLKPNAAWLTNYFALTHFSEANYVGMTSGQFTPCQQFDGSAASCHQDVDNLFHQLDTTATGWQSWMESMPEPCFLTSTGSAKDLNHYGAKHNPAIFFDDVEGEGGVWSPTDKSAECLANNIPTGGTGPNDMSAFDAAVQDGTTAPFDFVVPNECEDAHDNCKPQGNGITQFDDFLSREVPIIQTFDPDALIIVTFDEGTSNRGDGHGHQFKGGGNVAWFALGPQVVPGVYSSATYDHYSFLRTLEDGFGLPCLQAACAADPINGIWA
jgi:hypothetical protein